MSRFRGKLRAEDAPARIETYDRIRAVPVVESTKARSLELLEVGPGSHVLDVGCGCGEEVRSLAALTAPGGRAVGLDSDAAILAEAEARLAAADLEVKPELVLGEAAELPFEDASFDAVRADRVLLHSPRPDVVLAEMGRVTRPGGRIVITEVSNVFRLDDESLARTADLVVNGYQSPDERRGSVVELLPLLLSRTLQHPIEIVREHAVTSNWESMTALVQFDKVAQDYVHAGEIEHGWLERVREAAEKGRARMHIEALHVCASVPA